MNTPGLALLIISMSPLLAAAPHGGSYRGPGGSGGGYDGGAGTSTDKAPQSPRPAARSASTPRTITAKDSLGSSGSNGQQRVRPGVGVIARPRGIVIGEDFSKWQYWWEHNKASYLLIKQTLRFNAPVIGSDEFYMSRTKGQRGYVAARPSDQDIDTTIIPALQKALAVATNRDIVSSCLVALAKIGRDNETIQLLPLFRSYLTSPDQEVRETAAIAIGITQRPAATKTLIDLALDTQAGRAMTGRSRVDLRTRAFAVYGMGLIAHAGKRAGIRLQVSRAANKILSDTTIVDRNVKVAAVNALGLLGSTASDSPGIRAVTRSAIDMLIAFYDEDERIGRDVVRAHVPTAIARLIGRNASPLALKQKQLYATELRVGAERSELIVRSAALALGQLALPPGHHKADAPSSAALHRYFKAGKDSQARYFCLIALAQIGGIENRNFLLKVLQQGKRELERPWAAIALGCLAHRARSSKNPLPIAPIGGAMHAAFRATRTPYARGALAIGLGLCGYEKAAPDLIKHLTSHAHQDEMTGYICVGLALMGHESALDPIIDVLDKSVRRPHRMRMASIALGKLGDRRLSQRLLRMLSTNDPSLAKVAAVASALSQIGDRASIAPLCRTLGNQEIPAISRAFAAVALGGIADKELESWNSKIAQNMNYRAAVETLVQSGAGVLEIL